MPRLISSAEADKPAAPAPITTTSGLDCAKEIPGNVASASPDKEVFRNSPSSYSIYKYFFHFSMLCFFKSPFISSSIAGSSIVAGIL